MALDTYDKCYFSRSRQAVYYILCNYISKDNFINNWMHSMQSRRILGIDIVLNNGRKQYTRNATQKLSSRLNELLYHLVLSGKSNYTFEQKLSLPVSYGANELDIL